MQDNIRASIDLEWKRLIKQYDARVVSGLKEVKNHPNRAVAFETQNFGWILSPVGPNGEPRKVLIQF